MSPLINVNLDDTPDVMPTLKVGLRTLTIKDADPEAVDRKGQTYLNVEFEVDEPDSDENGDKVWDRFYLEHKPARVKFKQLCNSAGIDGTSEGVDSSELIGTTVQALVVPNSYRDESGETVENTQIKKYVRDAD